MPKIRILKAEAELERILNIALSEKTRDPRLEWITFTRINLSPDFQFCTVHFTYLDDENIKPGEMARILTKCSGVFKQAIAEAHLLRVIPQLTFIHDTAEAEARKMDEILDKIRLERESREGTEVTDPGDAGDDGDE